VGFLPAGSENTGVRDFGDSGGASRFFPTFHYDAKASSRERQAGCEHLLWVKDKTAPIRWRRVQGDDIAVVGERVARAIETGKRDDGVARGNVHSTIKSIGCGEEDGLMRWLVRLVTPPGGTVGDPFMGSGSTAIAAQIEGHPFEGCDYDAGAIDIAQARLAFWTPERHREELLGITARREAAAQRAAEERAAVEASGQKGFGW
jgi:site-specific DNA-methyltransferase (adenine-specific)